MMVDKAGVGSRLKVSSTTRNESCAGKGNFYLDSL
jgi:hypothetical protein